MVCSPRTDQLEGTFFLLSFFLAEETLKDTQEQGNNSRISLRKLNNQLQGSAPIPTEKRKKLTNVTRVHLVAKVQRGTNTASALLCCAQTHQTK
jgi:hypothetical protein